MKLTNSKYELNIVSSQSLASLANQDKGINELRIKIETMAKEINLYKQLVFFIISFNSV